MKTKKNEIPTAFQLTPLHVNQYLVDGKLLKWTGGRSDVFSTIKTPSDQGEMEPTLLGSIPDMETETALEALDAAVTAFDRGQGDWPTMKVQDRLKSA